MAFLLPARAYGVPKVAISRAIADLEKSIGLQLMKRTTRRIFLTAAGDAVLPHARAISIEVEKVRQLAQSFSTSREGPLRVIADPAYGRVLLAPLVPRFLDSFPDIALDVVLDSGDDSDWDVGDSRGRQRRSEARCTTARRTARRVVSDSCRTF
jgi:DNA-binding transcriptional LysR family regulator